jgi:hypothetical protein
LADISVGGDWQDFNKFKAMVWRSLVAYRDTAGLRRYDYLDAYRLIDIYFEKDTDYETPRNLVQLDLLVLVLGLADVPNKLLPSLIVQALTLRRDAGRPTWVYAPYTRDRVNAVYGADVGMLIGEVSPVLYPSTPTGVAVPTPTEVETVLPTRMQWTGATSKRDRAGREKKGRR